VLGFLKDKRDREAIALALGSRSAVFFVSGHPMALLVIGACLSR